MSAMSGIGLAPDLATLFANANIADDIRFIKVCIRNGWSFVTRNRLQEAYYVSISTLPETLVFDLTVPVAGTFEDDLSHMERLDLLEDTVPAYILAKLAPSDWVLICYVPDSATVRDKVSAVQVCSLIQNDIYRHADALRFNSWFSY